jgi:hypothetical protein
MLNSPGGWSALLTVRAIWSPLGWAVSCLTHLPMSPLSRSDRCRLRGCAGRLPRARAGRGGSEAAGLSVLPGHPIARLAEGQEHAAARTWSSAAGNPARAPAAGRSAPCSSARTVTPMAWSTRGHVGTGFNSHALTHSASCSCHCPRHLPLPQARPPEDARSVVWVQPLRVPEVEFTGT